MCKTIEIQMKYVFEYHFAKLNLDLKGLVAELDKLSKAHWKK